MNWEKVHFELNIFNFTTDSTLEMRKEGKKEERKERRKVDTNTEKKMKDKSLQES